VFCEGRAVESKDAEIREPFDVYATHVYVTKGISGPKDTLKDVEVAIQKVKDDWFDPDNLANRFRGVQISVDADLAPSRSSYATLIDGVKGRGKAWGALAREKNTNITVHFAEPNTIRRIMIWGPQMDKAKIPAVFVRTNDSPVKVDDVQTDVQNDHIVLTFAPQTTPEVSLEFPPKTTLDIYEVEMYEKAAVREK
jgi:hypothetical protein